MRLEPLKSLHKCSLLSIFLHLVAEVTSNSKSMADTTVQVDLIWLLRLLENLFGFVTLFRREDLICLGCGDAQWTFDGAEFVVFDKGWVCAISDIDLA